MNCDRNEPTQPLQQFRQAVQGAFQEFHRSQEQLHRHLDSSLHRLALAHISGGVQTLPVRKEALVSAATLAAKVGAFFNQQPQKQPELPAGDGGVVCLEFTKGKRRVYRRKAGGENGSGGFDVTDDQVTHRHRVRDVFQDYLLPQGYPDSVAPQYGSYMCWRGVQYFFGGAISVYTTQALLKALGMSRGGRGEAAAAINWVLKDGAGRLGRFLFARWGRQLDCELKQFRLAGDVLMEAGAALELSTVLMPQAFLALACTANLAKNLAAVAASATRAPIYRTFARQNNMADITAKGESVANLADVLGTAFGIALARTNLPVVPMFALLSVGYLISSRKEVDSVVLPYLNRARLSYACGSFLNTGAVPGTAEANAREPLLPWSDPVGSRIVLGASVVEACQDPAALEAALKAFPGRQYAITYRPDTRKAYVLLLEGANSQQMLRATFDAQLLLFMANSQQPGKPAQRQRQHQQQSGAAAPASTGAGSSNSSSSSSHGAAGSPSRNSGSHTGVSSTSSSNNSSSSSTSSAGGPGQRGRGPSARPLAALDRAAAAMDSSAADWHEEAVRYVAKEGPHLYRQFERQAEAQGWRIPLTMLNASETRLRLAH